MTGTDGLPGEGKVALVTGAGSGIGAGIARWLTDQGVDVVLGDIDEDGLQDVAGDIESDSRGRALDVYMDVTDDASVGSVVGTVDEEFGRLDYLFANAGLSGPVELDDTTTDQWEAVMDVNVTGVFRTVTEATPLLRETDETSHVVVTASIAGRRPKPIMIPYRTSKAATIMLTRCFAAALGPEIKANVLCPGRIDTPLADDLYERRARAQGTTAEELKRQEEEGTPLGRMPENEDLHELLEFLLFRDAFLTGHEFHLDGGGHQAL